MPTEREISPTIAAILTFRNGSSKFSKLADLAFTKACRSVSSDDCLSKKTSMRCRSSCILGRVYQTINQKGGDEDEDEPTLPDLPRQQRLKGRKAPERVLQEIQVYHVHPVLPQYLTHSFARVRKIAQHR